MRAALFAALLTATASRADVEVAPPPRPKGVPFVPPKSEAKKVDPAETVGKIIKNAKDVTERLAQNDTGTDTRKTQDDTLALIDSLLNRQDDPPPQSGEDKKDQKQPDDAKDKKDKKDQQPKGGMEPKGGQEPKSGRRPRNQSGQEPKGGDPGGMEPMGGMKEPGAKEPAGMNPGAGDIGGKPIPPPKPTLPVDDDVVKNIWGHLPDKLRNEVTQYYKEEFMPRYADLLKQYYSSLSDKGAKPEKK